MYPSSCSSSYHCVRPGFKLHQGVLRIDHFGLASPCTNGFLRACLPNLLCLGLVTYWKRKGEMEAQVHPWTHSIPPPYFAFRYLLSAVGWLTLVKAWRSDLHRRKNFPPELLRTKLANEARCHLFTSAMLALICDSFIPLVTAEQRGIVRRNSQPYSY